MLLEVKEKHRIETLFDAEKFHDELKLEAGTEFKLTGFSYKEKTKKVKGEIEDQWLEVLVVKLFNEGV